MYVLGLGRCLIWQLATRWGVELSEHIKNVLCCTDEDIWALLSSQPRRTNKLQVLLWTLFQNVRWRYREIIQWFRAMDASLEDLGLISSIQKVTHNCLELQYQQIWCLFWARIQMKHRHSCKNTKILIIKWNTVH